MIWFKKIVLLAFLLAISTKSFVFGQGAASSTADDAQDEDSIDLTPPIDLTPEENQDDRGAGQIVGQSLLPLGHGLLPGPSNMFSSMFPALNSLLLLGNLFPAASLMGAPSLLGSTHQMGTSTTDESPAASKVVLVLAEDRNPHAAMRAANQEAARTIRQNDMLSQFLSQFSQADFGQMLSQSLEQMQQQNPGQLLQQNAGQLLQQIVPQELSQTWGQMLSQTFQQVPGLDLSQFPLLGQSPPSSEPTVGAAMDPEGGEGVTPEADAPPSASPQTFQFPNFQSAIDAGTQMLGQAFQQPNSDPNNAFQLPNIQSAFDTGTQMLGQAFQQANSDAPPSGFQLPNFQSVLDSGTQILSQSGSLLNLRPLQPSGPAASASDTEPAASQISEVRIKPDDFRLPTTFKEQQSQKDEKMDNLKMMSALQKAIVHKKLPILWFHIPSGSSEGQHEIESKTYSQTNPKNVDEMQLETKLQAFQRQVISELKLLRDIERKAKEMGAAAKGATTKPFKDNGVLSKIPIHKITRGDIEKALNDDYVKKILHNEAMTSRKETSNSPSEQLHVSSGLNIKRQTPMKPRQMTKEDIIRLMAYAYRMANANEIRMLESAESSKPTKDSVGNVRQSSGDSLKPTDHQWATDARNPIQMTDMRPTGRQWINDGVQMSNEKKTEQNPTRTPMGRQMEDKIERQRADEQQRQWMDPKPDKTPSMLQHPFQQKMMSKSPMIGQQTPMAMQQPHMVEQMQQHRPQQIPMTMQKPQMLGQQLQMNLQQPQMCGQMQQQQPQQIPVVGQQSPTELQQRQMGEQEQQHQVQQIPRIQQPHMVGQQVPMEIQQNMPQEAMQQMQKTTMMRQQPQMLGQQPPTDLQQRQMGEQMQHIQPQQTPMMIHQPMMVGQQAPMEKQQHMTLEAIQQLQKTMMMRQQPQMLGQQPPADLQQRQMGEQMQQNQPQQTPMMLHQPMMVGEQTPTEIQRTQMQNSQCDTKMLRQMTPDTETQMQKEIMLGEATPQIPENADKARFKGGSLFKEFDLLGLGGGKDIRKKPNDKPTIINYYYNAGGRGPSYGAGGYGGSSGYLRPSYGTGYGGGASGSYSNPNGYGGNAPSGYSSAGSYIISGYPTASTGTYRTAVGDEEIRAMLKEHSQMKVMPKPDRNPVIIADVSTNPTFQSTTITIDDMNQQHTTSHTTPTETPLKNDDKNRAKTTIEATQSSATSKLSRLDCKLEINSILDKGKSNGRGSIRYKRNANYGTLQAIDSKSLNELRKTYKESLKEITLNPDEDPAEALMRYNAASIREALEQANRAPMEISAGGVGVSTMEADNNEAYYDGIHVPALNHIHTQSNAVPQLNIYTADGHSQHSHYKLSVEPDMLQPHEKKPRKHQENLHNLNKVQAKTNVADRDINILPRKENPVKPIGETEYSLAITTTSASRQTTELNKDETLSPGMLGRSESEFNAVLDLIKQQMQACCDKCRDRFVHNIKGNIKETHSHKSSLKESQQNVAESDVHSKLAIIPSDDELFEKWLREMELKGYDSKYLTKSHHWEYLNSGKLALALDNIKYEQEGDNTLSKKTNDQSFKRYTPLSSMKTDLDHKSKKLNTSNRSTGKTFAKKKPELNYSIKETVHVLNDELSHLKLYSEEVTSSPYAMRGKFKNNNSKKHIGTVIVTTPVKFNTISQQQSPSINVVDEEDKAKSVELLSQPYDLSSCTESTTSPRTESTTSNKPTQPSVMAMPVVESTTVSPVQVSTTNRARTKRVRSKRKQKLESDMPTHLEQSSVGKR